MRTGVQASFFATKMAASTRGWTDRATSALLEALKTRESLWNTKCESYKNRNTKKKHYDEIVVIPREARPKASRSGVYNFVPQRAQAG